MASGIDAMIVDEALPWLKENGVKLIESIPQRKHKQAIGLYWLVGGGILTTAQ